MAEFAETLINLQSLKEKVTKPSQTVGGPIDVAVITKSEGLQGAVSLEAEGYRCLALPCKSPLVDFVVRTPTSASGRPSPLGRVNRQREEPDTQWKAAAFARWHGPDGASV